MIEVTLSVNKEAVFTEVAKTTSYTGAKMQEDEGAYKRIFTTDEDQSMLERFWDECKVAAAGALKKMLGAETESGGVYSLSLELSNAFNQELTESMQKSLFSFFVMAIAAKWYAFTNKQETAGYATEAAAYLEDVMKKAFYKRKPVRPTYN